MLLLYLRQKSFMANLFIACQSEFRFGEDVKFRNGSKFKLKLDLQFLGSKTTFSVCLAGARYRYKNCICKEKNISIKRKCWI